VISIAVLNFSNLLEEEKSLLKTPLNLCVHRIAAVSFDGAAAVGLWLSGAKVAGDREDGGDTIAPGDRDGVADGLRLTPGILDDDDEGVVTADGAWVAAAGINVGGHEGALVASGAVGTAFGIAVEGNEVGVLYDGARLAAVGINVGINEGASVADGVAVGTIVGVYDGPDTGALVLLGALVVDGLAEGAIGNKVGTNEGGLVDDGVAEGATGINVGINEGALVGTGITGSATGIDDGANEGALVGTGITGSATGIDDGANEGALVGTGITGSATGIDDGANEGGSVGTGITGNATGVNVGEFWGASVANGVTVGVAGMRGRADVGADVGGVVGVSVAGESVRLLIVGTIDNSIFDVDGESDGRNATEGLADKIPVGWPVSFEGCPVIAGTSMNVGGSPEPTGFGFADGWAVESLVGDGALGDPGRDAWLPTPVSTVGSIVAVPKAVGWLDLCSVGSTVGISVRLFRGKLDGWVVGSAVNGWTDISTEGW
jgi:hypothetical protein